MTKHYIKTITTHDSMMALAIRNRVFCTLEEYTPPFGGPKKLFNIADFVLLKAASKLDGGFVYLHSQKLTVNVL